MMPTLKGFDSTTDMHKLKNILFKDSEEEEK